MATVRVCFGWNVMGSFLINGLLLQEGESRREAAEDTTPVTSFYRLNQNHGDGGSLFWMEC